MFFPATTRVIGRRVPWSPKRITGLAFDYDPGQLGLANGAQVQTLTDMSGNGRDATQATAARRPVIVYNALNGYAGIQFTASSSHWMRTAAFSPVQAQPETIFLLAKASSAGTAQPFIHGIAAPNTQFIQITSGDSWAASAGTTVTGPARDSNYKVVTVVFNGASSRLRVNQAETTGNMGTQSLGGITLGSNPTNTQFLNGTIIRCFGYNRVLSSTEIARVERYLYRIAGFGNTWGVTFPAAGHIYQREGASTDLALEGTWITSGDTPTGIEANYKSGGWTDIGATINADGTWSGTLTGQAVGQGTLEVRQANATSDTRSILNVGVGDVFVVAGQSNAVGRFTNMQTYSHATLKASVYRQNSTVPDNCTDPTDSDVAWGSVWPPLATLIMADQSVPVMFITTATGSTGLVDADDWKANRTEYINCVTRVLASQVRGIKAVLWHQGEDDASNGVSTADYKTELSRMLDGMQAEFALPLSDSALASDTFAAANGTTINGRTPTTGPANWVTRVGTLEISSNKMVPTAVAATTGAIATMDLGETDVRIRATIRISGAAVNGIVLRYNPTDGTHYLASFATNGMRIFYYDGASYGSAFQSDSLPLPEDTDLEVMVAIKGQILAMSHGNSLLRYTNATNNPSSDHHGVRFSPAMLGSADSLVATTIDGFPLICAQIGERNEDGGTNAIRLAQSEIPDEDTDIKAGPLTYDIGPLQDGLHFRTDGEATKLSNRWWRAIEDALYSGTNGTGPVFVSAAEVDATHIDVTFSLPGAATTLVLGASPTVGWRVMDSGVERTVSSVSLQSATVLRLTLGASMTGTVTISFGYENDAVGTTIADDVSIPLPPVPFFDETVS